MFDSENNRGDLIGMLGDIAIAVLLGLLAAGMSAAGDAPDPMDREHDVKVGPKGASSW